MFLKVTLLASMKKNHNSTFLDVKTLLFQDEMPFGKRCSVEGGGNMSETLREVLLNICFFINIKEHMHTPYIQHGPGSSPKIID